MRTMPPNVASVASKPRAAPTKMLLKTVYTDVFGRANGLPFTKLATEPIYTPNPAYPETAVAFNPPLHEIVSPLDPTAFRIRSKV